ncbi:MAG TPA: nucleotidyltransferase domain-containing protein [Leptospiraceae bacterium]|nr:nucleotidyltransferase domain-containing protein [Leptospiraceae bacterium]HMZ63327.1 nucleotidyltransferase domain-containing protein [Leptospiraceae bacterium]HNA10345.1 nucleotidyltransferase domain-containing protein [Leptospiraceae bacterium]HNE09070.1 nucleotidyltransferase domain-containing protein [Leptospiraceae bacterium]HNE52319.1 nucleotidyltransferase domain-containing protein [Leptospiraceae bacterium]
MLKLYIGKEFRFQYIKTGSNGIITLNVVNPIKGSMDVMKQEFLDKIKKIQNKYQEQGFILLGIFGSVARGEETEKSDIDILYTIDATFPYKGLKKSVSIGIN